MSRIAIIDYQMGNLRSVQKGFEKVGHAATITSDPVELAAAEKVVLPGVGAFGDAMAELKRRELVGPIREAIAPISQMHAERLGASASDSLPSCNDDLQPESALLAGKLAK